MRNYFLCFVALVLGGLCLFLWARLDTTTTQLAQEHSLSVAIADSVHYFRDHFDRVVAEKSVIEASLALVRARAQALTPHQAALHQDVIHLPKSVQKRLVSATSIKQVVTIIAHASVDSVADSKQMWALRSDTLNYNIHVSGDTLVVDTLRIPNRVVVTHYRDRDDALHVTATNTNPMFKTLDVDAIVPPQPKPSKLPKIVLFIAGVGLGYWLTK